MRTGVGLRVALYFLAMLIVLSFGMSLGLAILSGPDAIERLTRAEDLEAVQGELLLFFWLEVATAPLVLLATGLWIRLFDRRTVASIGLGPWRSAPVGVGLAVAAAALVVAGWRVAVAATALWRVEPAFPTEELERLGSWLPLEATGALAMLGGFMVVALLEELIFRGYVYSTFRERFDWVHSAGLTSLLFVAFHAGHPDLGWFGLVSIFLLGLLLGAVREATGSIYTGALFHAVWNFGFACVLSQPLSGLRYPRWRSIEVEGPRWLTGATYGPEASAVVVALLFVLLVAAALWLERRALRTGGPTGPQPSVDDAG